MPIHQTKYGGLKRRSNYEEELDYLLYHQEHMIYPDRAASQMLNSPYMTQFHSEHFNIMSEQDKKRNEKIEADARLKITTASSGASGGGLIPAMAAQGAPPSGSAPPTYAMNAPNSPRGRAASDSGIVYGNFASTIREDVRDMRADTIQQREQLDIPAFQRPPAHLQPSSTPASYIPNIRPSLAQLQPSSVSGSYIRPFQPSTMRSQIPPNMQIEHSNIQMSMGAAVIAQEAASSSAMAAGFAPPVSKKGARDIDPADASTIAPTSVIGDGPFPDFGATPTDLKQMTLGALQGTRITRQRKDPELYETAEDITLASKEWNDWITINKPEQATWSTTDKEQKSSMFNKLIIFNFDKLYKNKYMM